MRYDRFKGRTVLAIEEIDWEDSQADSEYVIKFTDGTQIEFSSCGCCGGISVRSEELIEEQKAEQAKREEVRKVQEEAIAAEQRSRGLIA